MLGVAHGLLDRQDVRRLGLRREDRGRPLGAPDPGTHPHRAETAPGAVLELGDLTKIPTPSIEAVYACIKLLNKIMVLEGAGIRVNDAA